MLTDLVQISRLGEKKRPENERFRKYLKSHNWIEKHFKRIAENVEEQIDCLECANCCRVATAKVTERDVQKLAKFLGVKPHVVVRDYTIEDPDEGHILKRDDATGCVFLSGNECTVYDARPSSCELFPHVVKGEGSIQTRMWQFIDRACYCPIVYNTLEAWKEETDFSPTPK